MILDAKTHNEIPNTISADVVIVGAGPVGLFLATTLARVHKSVIIVDSGGRVADTVYNGETAESIGKEHSGVLVGRAMGLGGTSVLWGGQLAEFEEADLNREGAQWPLTFEDLRYWYDYVYDALGITNRLPAELYLKAFGGSIEPHANIERFFTFWLPQPNFATLFSQELSSNPLITLLLNTTVNNIVFSYDQARTVGAISRNGHTYTLHASNFVFAGGTIANNRFFLSTQCLSEVPWKINNLIGKYFQDHLAGKIADVDVLNETRFREFFENGFINKIKLQPKLKLTREARERVPSGVCGFFSFDSTIRENLENLKKLVRAFKSGLKFSELRTVPGDIWRLNRAFGPLVVRYIRNRRIFAFFDRALEFHVQAEQIPIRASQIRVLNDRGAFDGLCRVGVDWRVDGGEISVIRNFAAEADSYLQGSGVARLRIDPLLKKGDASFSDTLVDTSHQCGGLRMSATPSSGVTDPNCRVWQTNNVYVAGASVFPSSSHANCTLTALALAARLASKITQ